MIRPNMEHSEAETSKVKAERRRRSVGGCVVAMTRNLSTIIGLPGLPASKIEAEEETQGEAQAEAQANGQH